MFEGMPLKLHRTVMTSWDADSVFRYLLDFEHAEEWDAGTLTCERVEGDGGVGTRYRNISRFLGRRTTLDYEVERIVPGRHFVLIGGNKTVVSKDTVVVTPSTFGGTEVEYRARLSFRGLAAMTSPLLTPFLNRLADHTEERLRATLDARAAAA